VSYQRRLPALALAAGLPAVLLALAFLWHAPWPTWARVVPAVLVVGAWLGLVAVLHHELVRPLQTLANVLAAFRGGDYSLRARAEGKDRALGLVSHEVNTLGETLRTERIGTLEATALLRGVLEEIDVAVFAFDAEDRLWLVNRAGAQLLDRPARALTGRPAAAVGLAPFLSGDSPRVVEMTFPGGSGRWELRRTALRHEGRPQKLLVLSDLSRVLREEERKAWRRLVRVLGHEINNSLAPIRSIAESLRDGLGDGGTSLEPSDVEQGLGIISGRAAALGRFMTSYARLARLPPPELDAVEVGTWVERVAKLETRLPVTVVPGADVTIRADSDQLDQMLINLVDNAVDAASETGGGVRVRWRTTALYVEVLVEDEGPGVSDTANLFVPFFTTKPDGSGIGLALGRQIAEAHGGSLTLRNRTGGRGCVATIVLPRPGAAGEG
jgi:two-component system, NtrC family, nitrogen regulation sensor histidine kinase NtrY